MAAETITHVSHKTGPYYYPCASAWLGVRADSHTYESGDIIKGPKVMRDLKICDAVVANEELDSNATPTATAKLRLNNGSTQTNLVSVTAATLGVDDGFTRLNIDDAAFFVVPANGYWLELIFDAAFATAAAGVIAFGIEVVGIMWGDESPIAPAG